MTPIYHRILLKLSGESLAADQGTGIDAQRVADYATQIKEIVDAGVQVAIVVGGGNIFRGLKGAAQGFDRVKGDQMGMLATVINALWRFPQPLKPLANLLKYSQPSACSPSANLTASGAPLRPCRQVK